MTLDNLIGISLEKIPSNPEAIKRLLHAAERNIMDSKIDLVSAENRFDAAYKAIMQLANAALQANGYRTLTSKPGHHQTMIQLLPQTLGTDKKTVIILDAMRKQRNIADYSGDIIHLGEEMTVRLPSNAEYSGQVEKEQYWLPKLALHLFNSSNTYATSYG